MDEGAAPSLVAAALVVALAVADLLADALPAARFLARAVSDAAAAAALSYEGDLLLVRLDLVGVEDAWLLVIAVAIRYGHGIHRGRRLRG